MQFLKTHYKVTTLIIIVCSVATIGYWQMQLMRWGQGQLCEFRHALHQYGMTELFSLRNSEGEEDITEVPH